MPTKGLKQDWNTADFIAIAVATITVAIPRALTENFARNI